MSDLKIASLENSTEENKSTILDLEGRIESLREKESQNAIVSDCLNEKLDYYNDMELKASVIEERILNIQERINEIEDSECSISENIEKKQRMIEELRQRSEKNESQIEYLENPPSCD